MAQATLTLKEFHECINYLLYEEEQELKRHGKMDYLIAWLCLVVRKTFTKRNETLSDFLIPFGETSAKYGNKSKQDWEKSRNRIASDLAGWARSMNQSLRQSGAKKTRVPTVKEMQEHDKQLDRQRR